VWLLMTAFGLVLFSLLLSLSAVVAWTGTARKFTIVNQCSADIWVGTAGSPTPGGTSGWRQTKGTTKVITVAGNSSAARIWGQTGCSFNSAGKPTNCQTGTNGAENTLFEWTFGEWENLDWADISLVDGWNMPMYVSTSVAGASGYSCGPIDCTQFSPSSCPAELTVKNANGTFQFCKNVCNAVNDASLVAKYPILSSKKAAVLNCCSGKCTPTTWPASSSGVNYYQVFKNKCKTSYAWSGDDPTSTFTCNKSPNYTITFCAAPRFAERHLKGDESNSLQPTPQSV